MVGLSVVEIASKHNGFVTTSQVTNSGIPRSKLAEAVEEGALIRIDRGLYALPEVWEDPYLIAQHRFSRGIFSDDTALFLHQPAQLAGPFYKKYAVEHIKLFHSL